MSRIVILGNCTEWLKASLKDLETIENAKFINTLYPCQNKILMRIAQIHLSRRMKLPFQSIWFPLFCRNICNSLEEDLILIFYDWNRLAVNTCFLKYLRRKYKKLKLVYVFTNIIEITFAAKTSFIEKLNDYYDLVYAFDKKDSEKYGFKQTQLLYSPLEVGKIGNNGKVFFAGSAKDRLKSLLDSYDRFDMLGIKCNYHILNVKDEEIVAKEGIEYNKPIPYEEVVRQTKESSCIIEFKQGNSSAFTIKICEAIFYDKLLITTNSLIKKTPFYDERYMLVIDDVSDIKLDFFKNIGKVKYSSQAKYYFSVQRFLDDVKNNMEGKIDE